MKSEDAASHVCSKTQFCHILLHSTGKLPIGLMWRGKIFGEFSYPNFFVKWSRTVIEIFSLILAKSGDMVGLLICHHGMCNGLIIK